jgi:serine/threonine protein kinase
MMRKFNMEEEGSSTYYYRPFDHADSFYVQVDYIEKIRAQLKGKQSAKIDEAGGVDIFDMSFNKCTRFSFRLSNVTSDVTFQQMKDYFDRKLSDFHVKAFIYLGAEQRPTNPYVIANVTLVAKHIENLTTALAYVQQSVSRQELMNGLREPIRVLPVGCPPVFAAVQAEMRYIIQAEKLKAAEEDEPDEIMCYTGINPVEPNYAITLNDPVFSLELLENKIIHIATKREALMTLCMSEPQQIVKQVFADGAEVHFSTDEAFIIGRNANSTVLYGFYFQQSTSPPLAHENIDYTASIYIAVKLITGLPHATRERQSTYSQSEARNNAVGLRYYNSCVMNSMFMNYDVVIIEELALCSLEEILGSTEMTLTFLQKFPILRVLCLSVQYLHTRNITHGNIHTKNVMIMPNGQLKLADIGWLPVTATTASINQCTLTYQPSDIQQIAYWFNRAAEDRPFPDELQHLHSLSVLPFSMAGDVFMTGELLTIIMTSTPPYPTPKSIHAKESPVLDKSFLFEYPWLHHLVTHMLSHEPNSRPSINNVVAHPFFHSIVDLIWGKIAIMKRVICDYYPADGEYYRFEERYLRRIEEEVATQPEVERWYSLLPRNFFTLDRVEFKDYARSNLSSAYPERTEPVQALPYVAQFLHFMLSLFQSHLENGPKFYDIVRKSKTKAYEIVYTTPSQTKLKYNSPLEFFVYHPASTWFLARMWELDVTSA